MFVFGVGENDGDVMEVDGETFIVGNVVFDYFNLRSDLK